MKNTDMDLTGWDPVAVTVALGIRGSGKTTVAKALLSAAECRKVAWDPHSEFDQAGRVTKQQSAGPLAVALSLEDFLGEAPTALARPDCSIAVRPPFRDPSDEDGYDQDFAEFAKALTEGERAEPSERPLLVWVAEAQLLIKAPTARNWLDWWATQGRHVGKAGVGLGMDAQRAVAVPPTARTQVEFGFFGTQYHRLDLDAVGDCVGVTAPGLADALPKLKRYEFKQWVTPARRGDKEKRDE